MPLYLLNFAFIFVLLYNIEIFKRNKSIKEIDERGLAITCIGNSGRDSFIVYILSMIISKIAGFNLISLIITILVIDIIVYLFDLLILPRIFMKFKKEN